jgi:hypothetical protein
MAWTEYLKVIYLHRWEILCAFILVWHHRYLYREWLFNPTAGGNGKIQMDEIAKWIILGYAWRANELEGASAEQVYPDVYWFSIFFSIAAISGIKYYANNYKKSFSSSHSGGSDRSGVHADHTGKSEEAG